MPCTFIFQFLCSSSNIVPFLSTSSHTDGQSSFRSPTFLKLIVTTHVPPVYIKFCQNFHLCSVSTSPHERTEQFSLANFFAKLLCDNSTFFFHFVCCSFKIPFFFLSNLRLLTLNSRCLSVRYTPSDGQEGSPSFQPRVLITGCECLQPEQHPVQTFTRQMFSIHESALPGKSAASTNNSHSRYFFFYMEEH